MEMVGKKLEAELELFIMDCHALSKDGSFVVYRTHFGKCIPLCAGSKRRGRFPGIDFKKMDVRH